MIEEAIVQGIVQAGVGGIISYVIIKYVVSRLDTLSHDHSEILVAIAKLPGAKRGQKK